MSCPTGVSSMDSVAEMRVTPRFLSYAPTMASSKRFLAIRESL